MSRTKNSMHNVVVVIGAQLLISVGILVVRSVFTANLQYTHPEYLNVSAYLMNIMMVLSLVELGIGPAIIFSLYEPLAQNDITRIKALMNLYKKAYLIIGSAVLIIGFSLIPFLPYFQKELKDVPNITFIYILFVLATAATYFFSYKRSLLFANQENRFVTSVHCGALIAMDIGQIIVLIIWQNYFLYLGLKILFVVLENIVITLVANKKYPYMKGPNKEKVEKSESKKIFKNVRALMMHKVGEVLVLGTDTFLIANVADLASTYIFASYQIVVQGMLQMVQQVFRQLTASIGNLTVTESKEKILKIFYSVFFLSFWLFGFSAIAFFCVINTFIPIWLHGNNYTYGIGIVLVLTINFFLTGMRVAVLTFRDAMGIYTQDRYKVVFEVIINLGASLWLGHQWGVVGIFIGTTISTISTCIWVEPYTLYKYGLKSSVWPYFAKLGMYVGVTIGAGALTFGACQLCGMVVTSQILLLFCKILISIIIPNLIFFLIFFKTDEFAYFKEMLGKLKNKLFKRKASV